MNPETKLARRAYNANPSPERLLLHALPDPIRCAVKHDRWSGRILSPGKSESSLSNFKMRHEPAEDSKPILRGSVASCSCGWLKASFPADFITSMQDGKTHQLRHLIG